MMQFLSQTQKRQRYLLLLLVVILLIITFIWGRELVRKLKVPSLIEVKVPELKQVEIDFGVLENPKLKILKDFEKIKPFEEKIGRENPFQPPSP